MASFIFKIEEHINAETQEEALKQFVIKLLYEDITIKSMRVVGWYEKSVSIGDERKKITLKDLGG